MPGESHPQEAGDDGTPECRISNYHFIAFWNNCRQLCAASGEITYLPLAVLIMQLIRSA